MRKCILLLFLVCTVGIIYAQQVEQVEASLRGGEIQVTCLLQTDTYQDLSLYYSEDNGRTFLPCHTISGDINNQLQGGKIILWDCAKDGIVMGNFVFKVEPTTSSSQINESYAAQVNEQQLKSPVETPQRATPAVHTQDPQWKGYTLLMPGVVIGKPVSYSLMAGYTKRIGGYIRVKSNFVSKGDTSRSNLYSKSDNDDDDIDDGVDDGIDDDELQDAKEASKGRLSVSGGLIFGLTPSLYLYGGAGYAEKWAKDYSHVGEYSYSCLEIEAGLIYRIGNFSLSGGIGYLTKKSDIEANLAIGFMF